MDLSIVRYGVLIDGERGNRPHIYSQEEILKEAVSINIIEVMVKAESGFFSSFARLRK